MTVERNELKSGDAVLWKLGASTLVAYALVLNDGEVPPAADRSVGTEAEARRWAESLVAETGGEVRRIDPADQATSETHEVE